MLAIDKNLSVSTRDTDGSRFDFPLNEQTAQDMRIIQRNVIYIIGVPTAIADETILCTQPYFGQYGQILKVIVKRDCFTTGEDPEEYSSAYITYSTHFAACLAILSVQSKRIDKFKNLQASYATTKYCKYYVQRKHCKIKACSYFHVTAPKSEIVYKMESLSNMNMFEMQIKKAFQYAIKNFDLFVNIGKGNTNPKVETVMPSIESGVEYLKIMMYCHGSVNLGNEQWFKEVQEKNIANEEQKITPPFTENDSPDSNEDEKQKINHAPDTTLNTSNGLGQAAVNGLMVDGHGQSYRMNMMGQIMENNAQALINERAIMQEQLERRKKQETIKNELKLRGFDGKYFNNNTYPVSNIETQFGHNINPKYNMEYNLQYNLPQYGINQIDPKGIKNQEFNQHLIHAANQYNLAGLNENKMGLKPSFQEYPAPYNQFPSDYYNNFWDANFGFNHYSAAINQKKFENMAMMYPVGNQRPENYGIHINNYHQNLQHSQHYPGIPLGDYPMMNSTTQGYPNTSTAYNSSMYDYQTRAYIPEDTMLKEY